MKLPKPNGRVWVYHAPIDLRKSYYSLKSVVEEHLSKQATSGDAYVFINRGKTLAKVLWWDRTGWCLLLKKLSAGRYRVSENQELIELKIDTSQLFFDGL